MGSMRFDHLHYPGDLLALEACSLMREVELTGGATVYGDATAVGDFSFATATTLDTMIADCRAFWVNGIADTGTSTAKTGFSSATPYEYFDNFPTDKGFGSSDSSAGTWQYFQSNGNGNFVSGLNFAKAIRSAYGDAILKSDAEEVWDWLMTFTDNANITIDNNGFPAGLAANAHGTYDPSIALATELVVSVSGTPVAQNGSYAYELGTAGLMAKVQSERDPMLWTSSARWCAAMVAMESRFPGRAIQRNGSRCCYSAWSGSGSRSDYSRTPTRGTDSSSMIAWPPHT